MKLLILIVLIAIASATPNVKTIGHEELTDILLARFASGDFSLDTQVAEDEFKEAVVRSLLDEGYEDPTPITGFTEDITSNADTNVKVNVKNETTEIPSTSATTGSIAVSWNQRNGTLNVEGIRVTAKFGTSIQVKGQTVERDIAFGALIRIRQEDGGFEIDGDRARRRIIVDSLSDVVRTISATGFSQTKKRGVASRAIVLVHDAGDKNGRIATVITHVRARGLVSTTIKENKTKFGAETNGSLVTVIKRISNDENTFCEVPENVI